MKNLRIIQNIHRFAVVGGTLALFAFALTPAVSYAQSSGSTTKSGTTSSQSKSKGTTDKKSSDTSTDKSKSGDKLDINTATQAELTKLPGINSDTAKKIIANRPYANKAQLKSRDVVTDDAYNKITDMIIAKQPKKDSNTSSTPSSDSKSTKKKSTSE